MPEIQTFVFFDCETTGLPSQDGNTTKITELCLTAIHSDDILAEGFPRVQDKMTLCFNPKKDIHPIAAKVAKLTNDRLRRQSDFNPRTFNMIRDFLSSQDQPVCFVAHNGDDFDYPILRAELHNTGNELPKGILCMDTLKAFRELYQQDTTRGGTENKPFKGGAKNKKIKLAAEAEQEAANIDLDKSGCLYNLNFNSQVEETTPLEDKPQFCFKPVSKPVFKLDKIYRVITSKKPKDAHQAEQDTRMLIECAVVLKKRFINWANHHAKEFSSIPMMKPK